MSNIKVYNIDENNQYSGYVETYSIEDGAILIPPSTDSDVWDGVKWVTPVVYSDDVGSSGALSDSNTGVLGLDPDLEDINRDADTQMDYIVGATK